MPKRYTTMPLLVMLVAPRVALGQAPAQQPANVDSSAIKSATEASAELPDTPPPGPGPSVLPPAGAGPRAEAASTDSKTRMDETLEDLLEVPETPAAFTLGLSADVVARPSSLKEVAGALKTVIAPNGKLVPGAAIEVAPFYRLVTRDATATQWKDDLYRPILGGIRFSLATASDPQATDPNNAPTLVAVGARVGIDTTDIRFHKEVVNSVLKALAECAPPPTLPTGGRGVVTHLELDPVCEFEKVEEALTSGLSGVRAELAGTATFADRSVGDDEADVRAWRAWAAFEARTSANFGAGIAGDYQLVRQLGPDESNLRGGARVNLDTTQIDASLSAAYVRRSEEEQDKNWFDVGGAISAKLSTIGVISIGVQMARSLDDDQRNLTALLSLSSASGEPLISKYFGKTPP